MPATQAKLTIKRGQVAKDVTQAAGTTISGSDAIELNIDVTNMTEGEAAVLMDELKLAVLNRPWPMS